MDDAQVEIGANVYYLTVEVIDSEGAGVGNADVNVLRDGLAVASTITGKSGVEVFRLPIGYYSVNMTFRTTWHLTRIDIVKGQYLDLTANQTVTFKFTNDEYPLPFYKTNLFWIILLIIILAILIVFLLLKMRSTPAEPVAPEEGTDPIEYTDEDLDDLLENLDEDAPEGGVLVEAGATDAVAEEAARSEELTEDDEAPEDDGTYEEEEEEEPSDEETDVEYSDEDLDEEKD